MKRNPIYLINKLSEYELELLKKDLIDNSIEVALKIKNLKLPKTKIEEVIKVSIDRVLVTFRFNVGNSLGDLIQNQVMVDLKAEYEKTYPNRVNKVLWPDLVRKRPFDELLEILQKIKLLHETEINLIFNEVNKFLTLRQEKWLSTIYNDSSITYIRLSKQFGARGIHPSEEIKTIYKKLTQTLKDLKITL